MELKTGYKLLQHALTSLNGKFQYAQNGWQTVPGNGCYVAVTDGLTVGGFGDRLFQVECREPTGAIAPIGVICYREVRLVKELHELRLGSTCVKLYRRHGVEYGVCEGYYESGQLKYRYHYRQGQLRIGCEGYYESGQLMYRHHYRQGQLIKG